MQFITEHIAELKKLCEKHYVEELYVFGSAVTDTFSNNSDIDLLVKFAGVELLEYFDNYTDFKEAIEKLYRHKVDLLEIQTIKNPILKYSIEKSKQRIYG